MRVSHCVGIVIGVVLSTISFACINEFGTTLEGKILPVSDVLAYEIGEFDLLNKRETQEELLTSARITAQNPSVKNSNDFAAKAMRAGKPKAALRALLVNEKRVPGLYKRPPIWAQPMSLLETMFKHCVGFEKASSATPNRTTAPNGFMFVYCWQNWQLKKIPIGCKHSQF